jgi:hypothetical protein
VEAPGGREMGAMTSDEKFHGNIDRTHVEVAWSMGAQVSRSKRDEGKGDMTPRAWRVGVW